jgi:hypothetical protein
MPTTERTEVEQWKQIKGFEGLYSVSTSGRSRNDVTGKCLVPCGTRCGYFRVNLCRNGIVTRVPVARLVINEFNGPKPSDGHQINHIDGNKGNNAIENLEWVTASQNVRHSFDVLGKRGPYGARNGNARLTDEDIVRIRSMNGTMLHREIGLLFGISRSTVGDILSRKAWKHVA